MFTRTAFRTAGVARIAARNMSRTAPLRSVAGHAPSKPPSSDVPWIIGSIAFTIPAAAYLLNSGSAPAHAQEDAHHAVEAVKESVPEPKAAAESVKAAAESVKAAPASVTEKVKETAHAAAAKVEETIPAAKKVLPAAAGGEASEGRSAEDPAVRDPAAAKKDVDRDVTSGRMSDKQEGLSNTNTSNTILQSERGDAISKKGEGQPESAKLKGTVDVNSEDKKVEKNDDEAESKRAEEKEEKKEESSA